MDYQKTLEKLYRLRREAEVRASDRFERGGILPYTDELRELDRQIKEIEKKVPRIFTEEEKLLLGGITYEETEPFLFFTLNKNGELKRDIGGIYAMSITGSPYKIVKELNRVSKSRYYDTRDLANFLELTPAEVRKCIGDIKIQIKKIFKGVDGDDFIEGLKNSGYRLNPRIRISEE